MILLNRLQFNNEKVIAPLFLVFLRDFQFPNPTTAMSTPTTQVADTQDARINTPKSESEIGQTDSDIAKEELPSEEEVTYPEGGARGWFVAGGASAILFSTFGYANSFG